MVPGGDAVSGQEISISDTTEDTPPPPADSVEVVDGLDALPDLPDGTDACVPDCEGPDNPKECGDDGCGGACGACGEGETCVEYHWEPPVEICGEPGKYADCTYELEEVVCIEEGGTFGKYGLSPEPFCLCPTGDGGCPCDGPNDCVGVCWAPMDGDCQELTEGTCSETQMIFGCFCIFEEEGEAWGICID